MRDPITAITIVLEDGAILQAGTIAQHATRKGFRVTQMMAGIGVITGLGSTSIIEALAMIPGVKAVEEGVEVEVIFPEER